jgi:thiamine kinase-like enzyme
LLLEVKKYIDELRNIPHPYPRAIAAADMGSLFELQDEKSYKIVFTHGDLNTSNIIVKKGKIAALFDFEMSGFYPEYWEYTTVITVNRFDGFWKDEIPNFLDTYPPEVEMETIRRKHFGSRGLQEQFPWW